MSGSFYLEEQPECEKHGPGRPAPTRFIILLKILDLPINLEQQKYWMNYSKLKGKKLPKIPFCANIRSNAKMNIKTNFLHCLYKPYKIISSFKIVLSDESFKLVQVTGQQKK